MTWKCCVWKCCSTLSSRYRKSSFYRFPTPSKFGLSTRRFEAWKKALGLGDKFISSNKRKPARLTDVNDKDWVPTLHLHNRDDEIDKKETTSSTKSSRSSSCSSTTSSLSTTSSTSSLASTGTASSRTSSRSSSTRSSLSNAPSSRKSSRCSSTRSSSSNSPSFSSSFHSCVETQRPQTYSSSTTCNSSKSSHKTYQTQDVSPSSTVRCSRKMCRKSSNSSRTSSSNSLDLSQSMQDNDYHRQTSPSSRTHRTNQSPVNENLRKRRHLSSSSSCSFSSQEPLNSTLLPEYRNASTQTGVRNNSFAHSETGSSSSASIGIAASNNPLPLPDIHCCCCNENCEFFEQNKISNELLNKKIIRLTEKVETNARDFRLISVSDKKCLYYTGISSFKTVQHLFDYLKDNISQPHCEFSKEQVFVMTLTKLRLNHQFQTLAYDYNVCPNTISKYFHRTLEIMDKCLGYALEVPEKNVLSKHTPKIFKDQFGHRRIFIIDCFEVQSETPENPKAAVSHFSNYKKSETTKFLIAICPDGNISFISPGYGGRCSDKKIFQDSGILNFIEPGDVIIADKGFDIAELVQRKGAVPTFLSNKRQFKPAEIEKNKQVTRLRIHVERCIAGLKNKFLIISQTIPVDLLVRFENEKNIIDLVARVCCILYNFNASIIPK